MQASQDLFDLLISKDFTVKTLDNKGKAVVDPSKAEMFSFDYETPNKNYGTVVILINDNSELEVYYGDNVGKNMETDDKDNWYDFLNQMKRFATRNLYSFNLKNMNRLRYTMQGMAAIKEGLFEGWNGTKLTSYNNKRSNVRLKIVHDKPMGEDSQRWRAVKTMFIETPEGERFKLPFKSTSAGKAMTRHVMEGGTPYDVFGTHITDIVRETNALARFMRGKTRQVTEDHQDYELVQELKDRYKTLRKRIKQITGKRGYHAYKESWNPAQIEEGIVAKLAARIGKNMQVSELNEDDYDFNDGDLVQFVGKKYDGKVYILKDVDGQWWAVDPENKNFGYSVMDLSELEPADDNDDDAPAWDRSSGEDEYNLDENSIAQQINFGGMNDKESWWDKAKAVFTPNDDKNNEPEQSDDRKSKIKEGNVKKRFYQIRDMIAKLDERMAEEGCYGDPNIHTVAGKITSGDIDGAMEELWYAYEGESGDSGEYEKGPLIDDFKKEVEELMRVEESIAVDISGGKVPVGQHTLVYKVADVSPRWIENSLKSRDEDATVKVDGDKVIAHATAQAHSSVIGSMRKFRYNGTVTDLAHDRMQTESVPPGSYMIWTVEFKDGTTKQYKGNDEAKRSLEKKHPEAVKISTDWVVRSDEELYDDAKANNMKELNEFENWAAEVTEGTWAIPDTKDKVKALRDFMSQAQPVGIDGADAQNVMYDIIGNDDLMDDLYELSQDSADADARIVVQAWLEKNMPEIATKLGLAEGDVFTTKNGTNYKNGKPIGPVSDPDGGSATPDRYSPPTKDGVSPPTKKVDEEHDLDTSEPVKKQQRDPMLEMNDIARLAGLPNKVYEPVAEGKPDFLDLDNDGDTEEDMKKAAKEVDEAEEQHGMNDLGIAAAQDENGKFHAFLHDKHVGGPFDSIDQLKKFQTDYVNNPDYDFKSKAQALEAAISEEWEDEGLDDRSAAQQLDKMLASGKSLLAAAQELASYYGVEPWEVVDAGDAYGSPETKKLLAGFRKLLGTDLGEGNAFSGALANAKRDGKSEFEVDGKEYKVDEADAGKYGQADFDEKETATVAPGANTEMPEKELEEAAVGSAEWERNIHQRVASGQAKQSTPAQSQSAADAAFAELGGSGSGADSAFDELDNFKFDEGMADVMGDEEIRDPFPELPQVAHDGDADDYADKYSVGPGDTVGSKGKDTADGSRVGVQGKDTADDDLSWIKRALGNK